MCGGEVAFLQATRIPFQWVEIMYLEIMYVWIQRRLDSGLPKCFERSWKLSPIRYRMIAEAPCSTDKVLLFVIDDL
jgi:hypothetical protein